MSASRFTPLHTLTLIGLVILAYAPAWPGGFLVEDWLYLKKYRTWTVAETVRYELGRPLKDRAWVERERPDFFTAGLWRPVPYILAHLEQRAFDDWSGGWYLTRLGCHALTAWVFGAAVLAWTGRRSVGWLAGAFFGLHPSRLYPLLVLNQSQMLLASLGACLALWGLAAGRTGRRRAGTAAVVAGSALACWSYEQAVAVILLWPVADALWPGPDGARPPLKAAIRRAVPLLAIVALYIVLRIIRFEGFGGYTTLDDGDVLFDVTRPLTLVGGMAAATWSALISLAAPLSLQDWNLAAPLGAPAPRAAVALNLVLGAATGCLLAVRARGSRRAAAVGTGAVLVFIAWTVLPIAGLLHGHDAWNRYVYFPGFAWVVILAWGCAPAADSLRARLPAAVALTIALMTCWWGCRVWQEAWRQSWGMHTAVNRDVPDDTMAYVYTQDFSEWVGGRNLFIRNLEGPIDVGRDAKQLRLWPARWNGPASIPTRAYTWWPFGRPPFVRLGTWDAAAADLTLAPAPAYRPGGAGDVVTWDLRSRQGRRAWTPGALLEPERGPTPGLHLHVVSAFAALQGPALTAAWTPAVLGLDMAVTSGEARGDWLEVLFYTAEQPTISPAYVLRCRTQADGLQRRYQFVLLDHPAPALAGPITRIALRPSRLEGSQVYIREIWLAAAGAGPPARWPKQDDGGGA